MTPWFETKSMFDRVQPRRKPLRLLPFDDLDESRKFVCEHRHDDAATLPGDFLAGDAEFARFVTRYVVCV